MNAQIGNPVGGVFDKHGNYYFSTGITGNTIRKIAPSGIITTLAGNGTAGFSGDEGPAISAQLHQPGFIAIDSVGNIYIPDIANNRIRKVDAAGIIHTIAGDGNPSFSGDGGAATLASLQVPTCVYLDDTGNLYDVETARIRKINLNGIIQTIIGTGISGLAGDNGLASNAEVNPMSAYLASNNDLYIADLGNFRIRKVDGVTNIITTIAGDGSGGYNGDNIEAVFANMNPFAVIKDPSGNVYIADGSSRIRKISSTSVVTTIVGDGTHGFSGDGSSAVDAEIYDPEGLALDTCGNLYIADLGNHRIRKVSFNPQCWPEEVAAPTNNTTINIYPNPATTQITITGQLNNIALFNTLGQQLYTRQYTSSSKAIVDVSSLPTGVYLLKVNDTYIKKVIKQ